jgi:hypothetical protein
MGDRLLKSCLESVGKAYRQLNRALFRVECCKDVDTYVAKSSLDIPIIFSMHSVDFVSFS